MIECNLVFCNLNIWNILDLPKWQCRIRIPVTTADDAVLCENKEKSGETVL